MSALSNARVFVARHRSLVHRSSLRYARFSSGAPPPPPPPLSAADELLLDELCAPAPSSTAQRADALLARAGLCARADAGYMPTSQK